MAAGLVAGALAASALSRAMESILFGVSVADPVSYLAALGVLALAALAATLAPIHRALRIDPVAALNVPM